MTIFGLNNKSNYEVNSSRKIKKTSTDICSLKSTERTLGKKKYTVEPPYKTEDTKFEKTTHVDEYRNYWIIKNKKFK